LILRLEVDTFVVAVRVATEILVTERLVVDTCFAEILLILSVPLTAER
jgi:hypothetical protein